MSPDEESRQIMLANKIEGEYQKWVLSLPDMSFRAWESFFAIKDDADFYCRSDEEVFRRWKEVSDLPVYERAQFERWYEVLKDADMDFWDLPSSVKEALWKKSFSYRTNH